MINKELQTIFITKFNNDKNQLVDALQAVRDNGGTPADCTNILVRELKVSLSQADRILWKTKVWDDIKEHTFKMRDEFGNVLEDFTEDYKNNEH